MALWGTISNLLLINSRVSYFLNLFIHFESAVL